MKKLFIPFIAALSLSACTSVEVATVASSEIAANGDAVAVVQANAIGFTALLHTVDIVQSDMDTVINKLLVAEAKALGATRVDLKDARTSPRSGIYTLPSLILGFPMSRAVGVAVK